MNTPDKENYLQTAYNRLDEVHRSWHLALENYHDINGFRANINSAIQSLRNITFALQKQKDNLSGFDEWYSEWQEKMKAEPILKKLDNARRIIVHMEDLKLHSYGTATIESWLKEKELSFKFDPFKNTEEVAKGLYDAYFKLEPMPEPQRKRCVFILERCWIYEDIPEKELLEVISDAFIFFLEMLDDAQKVFSQTVDISNHSEYCNTESYDCMKITREQRAMAFAYNTGQKMTATKFSFKPSKKDMEKVKDKYGNLNESKRVTKLIEDIFPKEYPFDKAELFSRVAIANLIKDKHLVPVTFIFKNEEDPPAMISSAYFDQSEKILSQKNIADEIIKYKGKYVLSVVESFFYDKKYIADPSKAKNKQDTIYISLVSKDDIFMAFFPFKIILGKVVFGKPRVEREKTDKEHCQFALIPLIKALKEVG
jgi:hypothetical protein